MTKPEELVRELIMYVCEYSGRFGSRSQGHCPGGTGTRGEEPRASSCFRWLASRLNDVLDSREIRREGFARAGKERGGSFDRPCNSILSLALTPSLSSSHSFLIRFLFILPTLMFCFLALALSFYPFSPDPRSISPLPLLFIPLAFLFPLAFRNSSFLPLFQALFTIHSSRFEWDIWLRFFTVFLSSGAPVDYCSYVWGCRASATPAQKHTRVPRSSGGS